MDDIASLLRSLGCFFFYDRLRSLCFLVPVESEVAFPCAGSAVRWPRLEQTRELFSERRFRHAVGSQCGSWSLRGGCVPLVAVVYRLTMFRYNATRIKEVPHVSQGMVGGCFIIYLL